jgi:hypothetical protein
VTLTENVLSDEYSVKASKKTLYAGQIDQTAQIAQT